jgi:hypothetical protein
MFVMIIFPTNLPLTVPLAHASTNANLFVSAENSQWNNYFAGPQVIQVIVADSDINRLDQAYGEPVVTVNGKRLRMAQAVDGNWYGYFADRNQAIAADKTSGLNGKGLDFGEFCASSSTVSPSFSETKGFTVARHVSGSINLPSNPAAFDNCANLITGGGNALEHVVRANKTLTHATGTVTVGQLGFQDSNVWPIIQLYDFAAIPSAVSVDYQKNGGDQIVNLTFDRIPQNLITTTVDRNAYPQNSQVFVQVNDPQLNIDPTEDDSWTFGTNVNNAAVYYEAFTRNGVADADGTAGMQNLVGNLTTLMFNHNGKLTINGAAQGVRVVDFQANGKIIYTGTQRGDPALVSTNSITAGSQPLTLIESGGVSTGVFVNWDGAKKSEIITVDSPTIRGQSATVRYNDISTSLVGGFTFASLTQTAQNNTWASGQRIPVTLTDNDDNKNSKISERMFLWDPSYKRSTAMVIGTPFTLSSGGVGVESATLVGATTTTQIAPGIFKFGTSAALQNATGRNLAEDESFSARPIFNFTNQTSGSRPSINTGSALFVDLHTSMNTILKTIHNANNGNTEGFKGFNFFNYDLRSFSSLNGATGGSISNVKVYLAYNMTGTLVSHLTTGFPQDGLTLISITNSTQLQDLINLNVTSAKVVNPGVLTTNLFAIPKTSPIGLLFQFTTNGLSTISTSGEPFVADFFSVGLIGDGIQSAQRVNNGIYRYELEETGDNTGVFTGTNQYVMLNQLNVFDANTYSTLRPIQHDVLFPVIRDMLQSDARASQVTYLDLGQNGVNTQISTQQNIPTHTGVISFDGKTYKIGDTVTITLKDSDLNVNNDLIDIYTTVNPSPDPASNTVGRTGLGTYSDGSPFGRLLEITFDGIRWNDNSCFTGSTTLDGYETNLASTGFSLVETSPSDGVFTGTFQVPDQSCFNPTNALSTFGATVSVDYFDFADSAGKTTIESYSAVIGDQQETPAPDLHILFQSGFFTPKEGIDITGITNTAQNGRVHYIVQFDDLPSLRQVMTMEKLGIKLLEYVSGDAYFASSNVSDLHNLSSTSHIRMAGPLKKDYKISDDIVNQKTPGWADAGNNIVILTILLHDDFNMTEVLSHMNQLGSKIVFVQQVPSISGYFHFDDVNKIANDDNVKYIDFVDPGLAPENDNARRNSGVEILHKGTGTGTGLLGDGVTIFEFDQSPADSTNPGLIDAIMPTPTVTPTPPVVPHSTHVAGILVGNGTHSDCPLSIPGFDCQYEPNKWQGMAPHAKLISLGEAQSSNSNNDFLLDDHSDLTNKFLVALGIRPSPDLVSMSLGSIIGNVSPGDRCDKLGTYPISASYLDKIVNGTFSYPMIFFESAGNENQIGTDCRQDRPIYHSINPPATAKNIITVGAIYASNNTTEDDSSFGPTSDNRIKPDIVAPGSTTKTLGLISTVNDHKYGQMTGTSMAAAVAAGATALLIEEWHITHNSGSTVARPMPHTVKAILIHTAKNPRGLGPDYQYGWGILNALDAVNLVKDNGNSIKTGSIGSTNTRQQFTFSSLGSDVKATLVWDDPVGDPNKLPQLVNNLDVKLVDSCNHIFDQSFKCNGNFCHEQGIDDKNNVKMVVGHGITGTWTANVTGTTIAHGPQNFTLVVTSYTPSSNLPPPIINTPNDGFQASSSSVPVTGKANPNANVQVYVDGAFPSTTADSGGNWNTTVSNLSTGTNRIYATQSSTLGDSLDSNTVSVLVNNHGGTIHIPKWVKNNAKYWHDGSIDDSTFAQGIQYMIKQGIITIQPTHSCQAKPGVTIPAWVKINAGYWAAGDIDDVTFVLSIQYLITSGFIQV